LELINTLLQAEADLLYNGGIGTYIKASDESHADAKDRANDALRVNGNQLRVKVVGEGGNLGCTQNGRIEYALNGGNIYTDAIDNSAGVDCSDHEVNIKILLNAMMHKKTLSFEARNSLLVEMTPEVERLVLNDNYQQVQAISFLAKRSRQSIDAYRRLINALVREGKIDRAVEYLPSDKQLLQRKTEKLGLTRPEIATLYAYSKNILKAEIIASDIPDEEAFTVLLMQEFPRQLQERYLGLMNDHPLRREIIATQLSNQFIDRLGIDFIDRARRQTGGRVTDIMHAYVLSVRLLDIAALWKMIESLDDTVADPVQFDMFEKIYLLLRRSVRWFLRNQRTKMDMSLEYARYASPMTQFMQQLPTALSGIEAQDYHDILAGYIRAGVPEVLAKQVAICSVAFSSLDIVTASLECKKELEPLMVTYFRLTQALELDWLRSQIMLQPVDTHWDETMRSSLKQVRYLKKPHTLLLEPMQAASSRKQLSWASQFLMKML
jgi:glutamate dehydrogenase